jgi:hypothetical protein
MIGNHGFAEVEGFLRHFSRAGTMKHRSTNKRENIPSKQGAHTQTHKRHDERISHCNPTPGSKLHQPFWLPSGFVQKWGTIWIQSLVIASTPAPKSHIACRIRWQTALLGLVQQPGYLWTKFIQILGDLLLGKSSFTLYTLNFRVPCVQPQPLGKRNAGPIWLRITIQDTCPKTTWSCSMLFWGTLAPKDLIKPLVLASSFHQKDMPASSKGLIESEYLGWIMEAW